MKRRAFLLSAAALPLGEPAGLAAVLSPFASMGHSATIGVLAVGVPGPDAFLSAFRKGLAKTGFIEGQNIELVIQSAKGHAGRLPELAADLVARKVDVIVAFQTPTVAAAKQATSDIPIVMDAGDPVGMGLVDSFARPGGNVTGMSAATAELAPKNLELLQQFVPSFHRVALFLNKTDPFRKPFLEHAQRGADRLGIGLIPVFVDGPADLQHTFATAIRDNPNAALIQPSLPIKRVAELTLTNRLPAASLTETFPQAGGLMSYSADYAELWRHMAVYVAKILKGAKPADLPVAQPTKFNFVINLKTANTLGLTIPPVILTMADQTIE